MKLTTNPYGPTVQLTIVSASPAELAPFVTQLFNYGAVSNMPENYEPEKDKSIMVLSSDEKLRLFFRNRFESLEMADIRASFNGTPALSKFRAAKAACAQRAAAYVESEMAKIESCQMPIQSRRGSVYSEDGRLCGDLEAANNCDNVS